MHLFKQVIHHTPESVELEFTLAGIGSRAYALMVDYIVLGLCLTGFLTLWAFVGFQAIDSLTSWMGADVRLGTWMLAITILVSFAIYVGYFVFFETIWRGQTPGKRLERIRVVRDDGQPIGLGQATLRALLRSFDDTFFIGAFAIAFSRREKRLGDWAAGTIVVQEEQPTIASPLQVSDLARKAALELAGQADISRLAPDDFAVIREYLQRRQSFTPQAKVQVGLQLATQVKRAIALENLPPGMSVDLFLEAVYVAYQDNPHI
jgi:uncharacterized RDD family membrane protein YckC